MSKPVNQNNNPKRQRMGVMNEKGEKIFIDVLELAFPPRLLDACILWDNIVYRGKNKVFDEYFLPRLSWAKDYSSNMTYLMFDNNVVGRIKGLTPPEITSSMPELHIMAVPKNFRYASMTNLQPTIPVPEAVEQEVADEVS